MARVNQGSHSFTYHPHVYPQVEWTIPAFTSPAAEHHRTLAGTSRPVEGRRLSWPGAVHTSAKARLTSVAIWIQIRIRIAILIATKI